MAKLQVLVFWILIGFSNSEALLDGKLCRTQYIDLHRQTTGTLHIIIPNSYTDCTIELIPQFGYSVVLSILQYSVPAHHLLSVQDSDGYKIALLDQGLFTDNKKAIISERKLRIRYFVDKKYSASTQPPPTMATIEETKIQPEIESNELDVNDSMVIIMNGTSSVGFGFFYFTYTQVRNGPCETSEFACQNGKCLPKSYVCSGHNRCGDNSDNRKCVTGPQEAKITKKLPPFSTQTIILISSVGLIIVILVSAYIVFIVARSKKSRKTDDSTPPLQSVSSNVPSDQQPPRVPEEPSASMCTRVQNFFQNRKEDTVEENLQTLPSERFQVPSMYPSLQPTAPEYTLTRGRENQGFTRERE